MQLADKSLLPPCPQKILRNFLKSKQWKHSETFN